MVKVGDLTKTNLSVTSPSPYLGSFQRDMTAASGDQEIDIGFKPNLIIFSWGIDGSPDSRRGISFVQGTTRGYYSIFPGSMSFTKAQTSGNYIIAYETGSILQAGDPIVSDDDGFTVTWTKIGATSAGTLFINFVAFQ